MRKRMTKLAAAVTAAALVCTMLVPSGNSLAYAAANDGAHSVTGSSNVTGLQVPTLAYDDTSITIVWEKPEKYDDIADYNVYINGKFAGTARQNYKEHADWASSYMEAFYKGYEGSSIDMVDVDIHSFKADHLTPSTKYSFEVRPVNADGKELGTSNKLTQSTTAAKEEFNIKDYGAQTSEAYTTYNEDINAFIEKNTKAIQSAIDACTDGGKVVIPAGTYVAGALYLKSNMTLELEDGALLWGSPNTDHYEHNYLLYPYSTDTRAWSLLNAYSADEKQPYENIRIVGDGTINGNGWKYYDGSKTSDTVVYQKKDDLDPADEKYNLEMWYSKGKTNIAENAVLAADAYKKGMEEYNDATKAYATRPNLITLRGVNGIYIEGISVKNPAFHTIAILDSSNVVSNDVKYITNDCNNADGIEIGNTKNAMIFNSFFDTGDDSINFATGLGNGVNDTKQQASENIWTFNNFIRNGHGGAIAAGSHTGAGICDMLVEDNVINLNQMPFRFKSAPANGGGVYDVTIRDCAVANCKQLFVMTTSYGDKNQSFAVEPADTPAEFRNIKAYNITADKIEKNTFSLSADVGEAYKTWHTHHDLSFKDITCTNVSAQKSEVIKGCENVTFDNVAISWASSITKPTPWSSITYSKGLQFTGSTTSSALAENAMKAPVWGEDAALNAENVEEEGTEQAASSVALSWDAATDNTAVSSYSVDVCVNGEKVDEISAIKETKKQITGLSSGVDYEFTVYASDATGNKTKGPSTKVTTEGEKDTAPIKAGTDTAISFTGTGYTWSLATFENARVSDSRIRGYRVYVNDALSETFYIYKLQNGTDSEKISQNVRRLTAGSDNKIRIVAFTDAGITYECASGTVTTVENYDFHAPVWPEDAVLTVEQKDGNLVLSWPEASDESKVLGYRVYMDGVALSKDNETFNHVNGCYTTAETTYTVSGADLKKDHVFKVEAGDNWWKAAMGDGPFHWTLSGPKASYKAAAEKPVQPEAPEETKQPEKPVTVGAVSGTKASVTATSATISWNKAVNAEAYEVTYKDAAGKTVRKNVTSTTVKITGLAPKCSQTITVRAYKKTKSGTVYGKAAAVTVKTAALKVTSLKAYAVTNNAMKLSWKKNSEAAGYVVTYKDAAGKTKTVTVSSKDQTSIKVKDLASAKTYKFTVKPYVKVNGRQVTGDALTKSFKTAKTVKPAKVTITSLKKTKKSFQVAYKKAKNAAGYEVCYSLKKNSGYKRVNAKTSTKKTIKNLKSKRTYYVKVRAYTYDYKVVKKKVVKTKVYGSYSKVKSVKVK